MNGITKNKGKKSDSFSDVMPSLKNDSGANVGEVYLSRNANRLSFKKGPKNPIRILVEGDIQTPIVVETIITKAEIEQIDVSFAQILPALPIGNYYSGVIKVEYHGGVDGYDLLGESNPVFRFVNSDTQIIYWGWETSCLALQDAAKNYLWTVNLDNYNVNGISENYPQKMLTLADNGIYLTVYGNNDVGGYIAPAGGTGYLRVVAEVVVKTFGA